MTTQTCTPICDWITSSEAAKLIGVSTSTLGRWRTNLEDGKPVYGPTFKKNPGGANSHVQYRKSVVLKWIADQEVESKAN